MRTGRNAQTDRRKVTARGTLGQTHQTEGETERETRKLEKMVGNKGTPE